MKPKQLPSFEQLRERRADILTLTTEAKTDYIKSVLYNRLKSVNRDLYIITKNPIYK